MKEEWLFLKSTDEMKWEERVRELECSLLINAIKCMEWNKGLSTIISISNRFLRVPNRTPHLFLKINLNFH